RKQFTYDYVYGPHTSQENVYSDLAAPLVSQFLEGFNATILAYGQTFSGKTYTMGSNNDETTASETLGIIPRVFSDIMNGLKEQDGIENVVKVSFLEIYQEQIRDLLNMQNSHKEISIRDSKDGTIVIAGIHEEIVTNATQMQQCLESGGLARATGDTQMHMHSSRSHAIFTITLEQISHMGNQSEYLLDGEEEQQMVLRRSKLHLVDLAGAERLKRTGAEGVRLKESVKINSGLLALGNVISILGSDRVNDGHVPYRDSKLTRLLQDSLGGNSQTLMIACVSPLFEDMDETINTLK
ncbi:P-loop containing nucleoside triphosphate hydrolase protein, partial [Globomyces pollinis-pini]